MAYAERLAERIRSELGPDPGVTERKVFAGIAFMDRGNMCVGVIRDDLMARVGASAHEDALARPGGRAMDFAKRPMIGMVYVTPDAVATDEALRSWVDRCLAFTAPLPAKG